MFLCENLLAVVCASLFLYDCEYVYVFLGECVFFNGGVFERARLRIQANINLLIGSSVFWFLIFQISYSV